MGEGVRDPRLLTRLIRAGSRGGRVFRCSGVLQTMDKVEGSVGYVDALSCVCRRLHAGWFAPEYAPSCTFFVLHVARTPHLLISVEGYLFFTLRLRGRALGSVLRKPPIQAGMVVVRALAGTHIL